MSLKTDKIRKSREEFEKELTEQEDNTVDFSKFYGSGVSTVNEFRSEEEKLTESLITEKLLPLDELVPAPKEWNPYSPLGSEKFMEVTESILTVGLLDAIIVWKQPDGKNMILAGHNRVAIYKNLYEKDHNPKYKSIRARVYPQDLIDEDEARIIVIDSNWQSRTLSTKERAWSIVEKIRIYNKKPSIGRSERVRDTVGRVFGLGGRMVHSYAKLSTLVPEMLDLVSDIPLPIKVGEKIAFYSKADQKWMLEKYGEILSSKALKGFTSDMSREEINKLIETNTKSVEKKKTEKIIIELPYGYGSDFLEYFTQWRINNEISRDDFNITVR